MAPASSSNVAVHVSRVHCVDCHSECGASASSDFFTSVGGGVGVCSYAGVSVGTVVRVVDSSFSRCSADYGEDSARPAHADVFLFTNSALKGEGKKGRGRDWVSVQSKLQAVRIGEGQLNPSLYPPSLHTCTQTHARLVSGCRNVQAATVARPCVLHVTTRRRD
jgi:hypothetical protein